MPSKRYANFELLRIVAMLMIIALHYLVKGNVAAPYTESRSAVNYAAWFVEAFCIVAVNCYVLLSGYFLVESEWKPGRVLSLLCQILFYSLLVPVAMLCIGMLSWGELGLYDWIGFLFPIETEHYWFATAYLFLYLFAPVLAAGIKKMEKKTLQKVIVLLLLFFSVGKSVLPFSLVTDRYGYDYGWFLCLFLVAAYLRLYGCRWLEEKSHGLWLYIGMCVCIFTVSAAAGLLGDKVEAFAYYAEMPYTYNHLLCLFGAVGLFFAFKKMRLREGRAAGIIRRIAPYTFGVYLLHEHILVRYEWLNWLQVDTVRESFLFLPHMLWCICVVFLAGILVDFVRAYLFEKVNLLLEKESVIELGTIEKFYQKYHNAMENGLFIILLAFYPLFKINQGLDVVDTSYSLTNFQYFKTAEGSWMVATYLANAVGYFLMQLPKGDTLVGMNFYTGLIVSGFSLLMYFTLRKKMPAWLVFLGEMLAIGLCWCPSVILYNYLTYLLMGAGVLLLYRGICTVQEKIRFRYLLLAGICLGANVAVRMPNVVQAAFILALWYSAWSKKRAFSQTVKDTAACLFGYLLGFGGPYLTICIKYGVNAYPEMVLNMFAMTDKATDYKPSAMLIGMFGGYLDGVKWLVPAAACVALLYGLYLFISFMIEGKTALRKGLRIYQLLCIAVCGVLIRFYWGRGMFDFHYYYYGSIYQWAVLFLIAAVVCALSVLISNRRNPDDKVMALIILIQLFVTPLGGNNELYPAINNLFLAAPFTLWVCRDLLVSTREKSIHIPWKIMLAVLGLMVFVQSVGFHTQFVFLDGVWGEKRDTLLTGIPKVEGIYTNKENAELFMDLVEYAKQQDFAGREVILYGEVPGLSYFLDMPTAISTAWPDLDSFRLVRFEQDMEKVEQKLTQDTEQAGMEGLQNRPVVIVSSAIAAYRGEDAEAYQWFGVDTEKLDADEKLAVLLQFLDDHGYEETFCNMRYAVYE
ncbi:MAG: acyltransferase [Lachnospiraceae bacterium]|nr:acyltransferase [Lachnospiraceae bacterium]